jgi:hypothetical protein
MRQIAMAKCVCGASDWLPDCTIAMCEYDFREVQGKAEPRSAVAARGQAWGGPDMGPPARPDRLRRY